MTAARLGTFDAEKWWRPTDLAELPAITRAGSDDAVAAMDELLAGFCAPGDRLIFVGPSPAYVPDNAADWHLLAGDESALPAITAILRELRPGVPAHVFVEVHDAAEEVPLPTEADATVTWLHRDGMDDLLARAVAAAELPTGRVDAWLAGERSSMVALRAHLLDDRGYERGRVRPTTYWRRGETGN